MILLGLRSPTDYLTKKVACLLYPNDSFNISWEIFISFILLISCLITPLNFAFQKELDEINWYVTCGYIIDGFFFLEIIINFNCAYANEANEIIDDRK